MTIKYKNERVHWASARTYVKKPGLIGKITGQKEIRVPFQMVPEKGKPTLPRDEVRYILSDERVVVRGPEINDDTFCRDAEIKWYPSNLDQAKYISGNKERA